MFSLVFNTPDHCAETLHSGNMIVRLSRFRGPGADGSIMALPFSKIGPSWKRGIRFETSIYCEFFRADNRLGCVTAMFLVSTPERGHARVDVFWVGWGNHVHLRFPHASCYALLRYCDRMGVGAVSQ